MNNNIKLMWIAVIMIASFFIGKASADETTQMETYLKYHPLEGDSSYEEFEHIFGDKAIHYLNYR